MNLDYELKIIYISVGNQMVDCSDVIQWAEKWDWGVGEIVANRLRNNNFKDWETIIIITSDEQYAGFCILEKKDDWGKALDLSLTPFITSVYIDPKFRGQKLSEKLLDAACDFAHSLKFDTVYLISNQQNFYEKFGFEKFTKTLTHSGEMELVYKKYL